MNTETFTVINIFLQKKRILAAYIPPFMTFLSINAAFIGINLQTQDYYNMKTKNKPKLKKYQALE